MILKKSTLLLLVLLTSVFSWKALLAQDDVSNNLILEQDSILRLPSDSIFVPTDSLDVDSEIVLEPDSTAKKPNAIDAPIIFSATDSMVLKMDGRNIMYLFGEATVDYQSLNLSGEYIEVDANSSIVSSTFGLDSIGNEFGYPIFKDGDTEYEMRKARYNFKTKKMYITDVITQQGDGYITAERTKKMANDDLFMEDGKYTTCDNHDHPHFYFQLTKAKAQPGKRVIFGPAYLVVEDVPLPIGVPFGFFPFTKDYSSGVLMPTYGDELRRGFSLQDGGYYFAFNDYVDLALTGEIYSKGSWGLNARSNYRKRYKFSGNFSANYRVTKAGEDKLDPDYSISKDFQVRWSHSQDPKANPFHNFSANVDFSTSSYSRNDLSSVYSGDYTINTKGSSVNYSYKPANSPFSFNATAQIAQQMRDTLLSVTLPNLTINMRELYPLQRKEMVGKAKWYESIRFSYNGTFSNSLSAKEYEFMEKNIIKDWKNAVNHVIPVSASFNVLKNITLTASTNYTERWYTTSVDKRYNQEQDELAPVDTTYGFHRVYDYNFRVSANTKLYGMYKPLGIFGKWTEKTIIRHVVTPTVSFTGAPDFGDKRYGFWRERNYINKQGELVSSYFSPFEGQMYGVPAMGKQGTMGFSLDNNLEMKIPIANTDSTRKVTLIDQFRFSSGYNFLKDSLNWENISATLRLKFGTAYTLSLQGQFDVYLYDENERKINKTRLEAGKGFGRLISTGTSFSYSLNNSTIQKIFSRNKRSNDAGGELPPDPTQSNTKSDARETSQERTSLRQAQAKDENYDDNGYYLATIPWNLSLNYSMSVGYDKQNFDKVKREYPYALTHFLDVSGSITPTKNWTFSFNTNYNINDKRFTTLNCSVSRQMHCWQMSASFIPVGPYQSYHFTISASSSMLQDLKYSQSSSYRDAQNWGR